MATDKLERGPSRPAEVDALGSQAITPEHPCFPPQPLYPWTQGAQHAREFRPVGDSLVKALTCNSVVICAANLTLFASVSSSAKEDKVRVTNLRGSFGGLTLWSCASHRISIKLRNVKKEGRKGKEEKKRKKEMLWTGSVAQWSSMCLALSSPGFHP